MGLFLLIKRSTVYLKKGNQYRNFVNERRFGKLHLRFYTSVGVISTNC